MAAVLLFFALFFWQFPEFFSIGIYRLKEYKAAGIPIVPVKRGVTRAIIQIYLYTVLFVLSTVLLSPFGYTGLVFEIVMVIAGGYWIFVATRGFRAKDPEAWARRNFHISINMLLLYCVMISIGPLLP
jgi:protoheme IX farnesyltransferase